MIDWEKPIQTTDGRPATVLQRLAHKFLNGEEELIVVFVKKIDGTGFGDVFLVSGSGYRCDDRANFSELHGDALIQNVPVKRSGWIRLRPPDWPEVAATKEEIEALLQEEDYANGWRAVYARWEE